MTKTSMIRMLVCLSFLVLGCDCAFAQARRVNDIEYARVGDHVLLLDLYLPEEGNTPLVVWVHGGAWRSGSKKRMPLGFLVDQGYAVASVDYRLSGVAKFPAQVHDCKAAIRFLRANAAKYGYNAKKIGIAGSSAGGHLVAEVGVTNQNEALEGSVGDHTDVSSDVSAIVDLYGPTNFMTILKQSTPHGLSVRVSRVGFTVGRRPRSKNLNSPDWLVRFFKSASDHRRCC